MFTQHIMMGLTILFVFVICYHSTVTDFQTCYPDKEVINEFTKNLTGYALKPGDSQYQNASTMINSLYYRHPGMVVVAQSVEDVQKSVLFARKYNLHVTVHSSGHDFNGRSTADGSLMIDLSSMKEITINLNSTRHDAGEITVDSGNSWIRIYEKVVVADGSIVDCTADGSTIYHTNRTVQTTRNTDLFWALRGGGGGTFGIVVKFTYKLHHQPRQLVKMTLTLSLNVSPKPFMVGFNFLEAFNKFIKNLPDEYGGYLILDNFPKETQAINRIGTYGLLLIKFGPWDNKTENVLDPFKDCILRHGCELKIENKTSFYDYEKEVFEHSIYRVYILGTFLQPETLNIGFTTLISSELVLLRRKNVSIACGGILMGGKISQYPKDSTPIHPGFRNGLVCMTCVVVMLDPSKDKENNAAGKKFSRQLQQYGNGVYMNEAAYDLDNWQEAFWGNNYNRLQEIKRKWDPTNFFTCYHCVGSELETTSKQIVTCDEQN